MNILSYNIRGLGKGIKWASIRNLVGKHKIDLLCLQETKRDSIDKALCQALWGHSDFDWKWFPAVNTAGGLLCVRNNNNFQVDIKIAERGFIMLEGVWLVESQRVVVANIYASCELESKRQLWQRLYLMKNQSQVQCWCLVGDFNCIKHPAERVGSTLCNPDTNLIAEFNEWLAEMEVDDIPCLGKPFTWVRPNGSCKSKLDRVLVFDDWVSKWPDSSLHNLERNYSDHCPIILNSKNIDWGLKPFRVFDAWLHNKDFNKVVRDCWSANQPMGWGGYALKCKLQKIKQRLKTWSKENCGDLGNKVKLIQHKLNDLENSLTAQPTDQQVQELKKAQSDLWEQSILHESILRQKSRCKWIKEGDSNTSYFHKIINSSRRRNALRGMQINGSWVENPSAIKDAVLQHFKGRFVEPYLHRPNLDGVSFNVLPSIQSEMLVEPFKEEEISSAVWACGSEKSPGPDGLNFSFIKHFWKELKPEFLRFFSEFYVNAVFPKGLNSSFIALIPKIKDPQLISDFRPISLIGCVYKIIAKVLSNRLSKVMNHLIDERQSVFVKGRQLLHGVLIANEVVEEVWRSKRPCLVFKVDFEKAYDSVSWHFLFYMMRRMGFHEKWIGWIKGCLSSTSISILVNGSPTSEFKPQRGLRQGDPLAPFLFDLVAEGLTGMMRAVFSKNYYHNFMVGKKKIPVNILQFADDTIFFGEPSMDNVTVIKAILKSFEMVSGLRINFANSQFGAIGQTEDWCRFAADYLNCGPLQFPFSYLGMPIGVNPRRKVVWEPIIRKFEAKLNKWNQRNVSMAGRITLISSVLTALPLFYMSFFRAPSVVINRLTTIQRHFLWGGGVEGKKITWVAWDQVCAPRDKGGLGIKNIKAFNRALLIMWKWLMFQQPDQLWSRILTSKYKGWRGLEEGLPKQTHSFWWSDLRSIIHHSSMGDVLKQFLWKLGSGDQILFWEDS